MTSSGSRKGRWALLVTLVLLGAVAALAWTGLRTGHVGIGAAPVPTQTANSASPSQTPTPAAPGPSPAPSPTLAIVQPDPELVGSFEALTAELGGEYALAWVDGEGLHGLGEPVDQTAWSTIKVPLAIAAAEQAAAAGGPDPWPQIEAAITRSDNDAAMRLWSSLGPPEAAAAAVDEVLTAYDSAGTTTQSETVRPPFSSFGQTQWSLQDQARFAAALACVNDASVAGEVRSVMGRVVADQRWGIGRLEEAHAKSGWGPDPSGAYVLRQLGDGTVGEQRYALAVAGRAASGTYAQAAADLSALVGWWLPVASDGQGLSCGQ